MAKKKNPKNTVENVIGRCGIPTVKTVEVYKRCEGALEMVGDDFEQAVNNLSAPGFFGARRNLKKSSIRYYVGGVNRLPAGERSRLKNMSPSTIISRIAQLKKK